MERSGEGLVDEIGGIDRAIEMVKKKAGIPAAERVAVEIYPEPTSILDMLLRRSSADDLLESRLAGVFGGMPFLAWIKGGYLRLMPYWVDAR